MRATTILGLDFGERRIGVALSDTSKLLASGLMTLDCKQNPKYMDALAEIIREEEVSEIVIGYPLRTDGKIVPGGKTEAVDAFITRLEEKFKVPVHREDESLTSQMASASLKARGGVSMGGKKSGKKHGKRRGQQDKAEIDRVAACFILQDYLDRLRA